MSNTSAQPSVLQGAEAGTATLTPLTISGVEHQIQTQDVVVSSIFETGEPRLRHDQKSRLIGLDCLGAIRSGDTDRAEFIPRNLFFRECMDKFLRRMIDLRHLRRRIVIGAPGVGKSILSFLCCLYQVARHGVNTLYMRKTAEGYPISIFWMTPVDNAPDTVRIQFTHDIPNERELVVVRDTVLINLYGIAFPRIAVYKCMVDGPRHKSEDALGSADLVTSGGYPSIKSEQRGLVQRVILDSWLEEETVGCLKALKLAKTTKEAKELHDICGGEIRVAADLCGNTEGIEELKGDLTALVGDISPETFELITTSTSRSSDTNSVDRLRAMFATDDTLRHSRQVVQSTFVLRSLQARMPLRTIRKYMLNARNATPSSLYGIYFEAFGHRLMSTVAAVPSGLTPHIIDFSFKLAEGGWKESASMLDASDVYWQPDSENFPNIDAAIVVSAVLHCIQYYAGGLGYHKFNITGFFEYFLQQLPRSLCVSKVVVHFVTPEDRDCDRVAIPLSQKDKFEDLIVVDDEGLEIKWTKKNEGDEGAITSSTLVEGGAIAQEAGAAEGLADDSELAETVHMDISDSEYEQSSSSDGSDGEFSSAGLEAIQHFLPIHICRDILNTNTDHTTEAPFEFLRAAVKE